MKKKKEKGKKEEEILNDINLLLNDTMSAHERETLLIAKKRLEKKEYFPKIIRSLQAGLTPLAMRHELSKGGSELYLKITSHKFMAKDLSGLIFSVGWFH
ncbi:MAG: bacteriocin immunity protein [Lactobacillales bacterium]|jgi:hypothetical protein|nr:bacteriocin immunity protein [Lactobacillales bacterium]